MNTGPGSNRKLQAIRYRTGLRIPHSGIYLVRHKQHRLPHEVTLLAGEKFPPCANCHAAVQFELLHSITDESLASFKVTLHQLPELPERPAVDQKKAS